MLKLTPNSVKRPKGVRLQFEKSTDGLYVVRNAYQGHYEYFKGRPLSRRVQRAPSTPAVFERA